MSSEQMERELLELAAKAAGIPVQESSFLGHKGLSHAGSVTPWDPLHDDGDALRLAVKLGIEIGDYHQYGRALAYLRDGMKEFWEVGDPYAATRLAIVRAAAQLAKGAEK